MRAVVMREYGDADGLEVVETDVPVASAGQVLLRVEAIGVGGVDAVIRRGTIGTGVLPVGSIPGSEVAGTVLAVGEGVDPAWVARRVWAFTGIGGAYAEHAVALIDDVVPLPDGLGAVDAVTLGSAAPVAHFALERAGLAAGERALIRGAAGSIGVAAIELAARAGASVVAVTTSSGERGERMRGFGATEVLDRDGHGSGIAAGDFDVIVDVVSGPATAAFLDLLAPGGRLVAVGAVAGPPSDDLGAAIFRSFRRSISYGTLSLDTVSRDAVREARMRFFREAVDGALHAVVHDVLPLEGAADAHRRMDAGEVVGRIVLVP